VRDLVRTERGIDLVWRAYELRPEPVPPLDPDGDYIRNAWKNSVYPLAEKLGVTMKLPPVQPRTRRAHEAAKWARTRGRFDAYHEAVFRAFFERGEDIGQIPVLTGLAVDLGLDGDLLREALERRVFEPDVVGDERDAERLGVRGVPAFVVDRRALLGGVQTVETLRRVIDHVRAA
jgi:predicted DsbA family dithiol-disulfide isomerase